MICDICNAELPQEKGFIYPVTVFRQILAKGFPMDEITVQMLCEGGMPRELAINSLRHEFMASPSDWFLCPRCAVKAESVCGRFPKLFKNKWPSGKCAFEVCYFPPELTHLNGIIPLRVVIDSSIGDEIGLYWMDRTSFIYDLGSLRPFQLFLKTGFFRSSNGPLMFLLFYIPDPAKSVQPFASVDFHINLFQPEMMDVLWDLSTQTHWHLTLLGAENKVVDFFEFENIFGLAQVLLAAEEIKQKVPCFDFMAVKQEFMDKYSLDDLYKMGK